MAPGLRRAGWLLAVLLAAVLAAAGNRLWPSDQPPPRHNESERRQRGGVPAPFEARSIGISDGDSFVVRDKDDTRLRIRLAGIDAPEKSQPWANVARDRLGALLRDQTLVVTALKTDRWGRLVALVDAGQRDVSLALLESGLAWHYARYDDELPAALRQRYARAAEEARRQGIGLLRDAKPEPPLEFRKRNR